MSKVDFVNKALALFTNISERDGAVLVPTHCLYPSNAAVVVAVRGRSGDSQVSDEGRAIDELTTYNRDISDADRFLQKFVKAAGLEAKEGKILSPPVSDAQLPAAVSFVANASAQAVAWGLDHLKVKHRRDLRKELERFLSHLFPADHIQRDRVLVGKSNRRYKIDHVIRFDHKRRLLIDPVLPDANSINSHAVAHLDIRQLEDPDLVQKLVYDEQMKWDAADLNFLRMAAPLVPLSHAKEAFAEELVA